MQKPKNLKELKKDAKFLKDQNESAVPKRISDLKTSVKGAIEQDKKSAIKKYKKGGMKDESYMKKGGTKMSSYKKGGKKK